ncbi:MAG TPA: efflux RND transporter periplasmic adaptor subunit [Steroidobacteraceae bacterium]|nr:efflux RND transporter periplasmic adaptor subunit [Steroidobacteraceae bacterium]
MKQLALIATLTLSCLAAACSDQSSPVPSSAAGGAPTPDANVPASSEAQQYTCSMHPHYISTDPNGTCPICGMDLVPVPTAASVAGSDGSVVVPSEMIQTMGIRTVPVTMAPFGRNLRAYGTVQASERLENASVSRFEGWVENLTVRAEGDAVRKGALLYRVYSPELIAAQKDYLSAMRIGNRQRTAAARQRMRSRGMQDSVIERITESSQVIERVPVFAEASGIVAKLQVREGDYVRAGTPILRLQSYGQVWVIASIPEQDIAAIRVGMPVRLNFPSAPDAPATGVIDYLYPTIDRRTRTADVRIVVDNSAGRLRPGAYVDVAIELASEPRLSVPSESVLQDGDGSHVIVALGEGRFAARRIRTGITANGRTEVLDSLAAGERVVASGQFLLDSEVNLRQGLAKLQAEPMAPDTPLSQLPIDATALAEIDHFTDMALYLHEALTAGDKIDPLFLEPAIKLGDQLARRYAGSKLMPVLAEGQAALRAAQQAPEGDPLRVQLARLLAALEPWLLTGAPSHYRQVGLALYRDAATDRLWLQKAGVPINPYGAGDAKLIAWPEPMSGESMATMDDRPPSRAPNDSHAEHRH